MKDSWRRAVSDAQYGRGCASSHLLVHIQLPENLRCVEQVLVLEYLLCIPREHGQVEDECNPVSVDQEHEGEETMHGSFWDDVRVETVAEIDRVNVVAVMKRVSRVRD